MIRLRTFADPFCAASSVSLLMMLNEMRPVLEIAPGPDQLHEPALRFSFSQIDKPIDGRDHDRPADDIAYRHGN